MNVILSNVLEQIEIDRYLEYPDSEEGLVAFWDTYTELV